MLLKLLVVLYAWMWNVEPWQPAEPTDWVLVIMASLFLDVGALAATVLGIIQYIQAKRRSR